MDPYVVVQFAQNGLAFDMAYILAKMGTTSATQILIMLINFTIIGKMINVLFLHSILLILLIF